MRREAAWVAVLVVVAALAVPAAAVDRAAGVGGIHGVIRDSTTGAPVDLTLGGIISVDVFNTGTMARTAVWVNGTNDGLYSFPSLAAGDYKLRFRYWDADSNLVAYRWYANKANFDLADPIHVVAGASVVVNATLRPLAGAAVSGTLSERGTGTPLDSACYTVQLFEASGIGFGSIAGMEAGGAWSLSQVPAGDWKALAVYTTGSWDSDGDGSADVLCGASPAHLDTWYGGASGWPLKLPGLLAQAATFATGTALSVTAGVPAEDVDIAMLPAPTCRGNVPTIFGTTLGDSITGTGARDIISGLAGSDVVQGLGGNDLICGDAGNDTIDAGAGVKDRIDGGAGVDTCTNGETTYRCP